MVLVFINEAYCRDSQALLFVDKELKEDSDVLSDEFEECWRDVEGPILIAKFQHSTISQAHEFVKTVYPKAPDEIFDYLEVPTND